MDFRKIVIVSVVALAIFASMSVASAGFLEDLFGGEEAEPYNVTINGFNFTIPGDLEELENFSVTANVLNDEGQTVDSKIYGNNLTGEFVAIRIYSYNYTDVIYAGSDDINDTEKTIAGKDGHFIDSGDYVEFLYLENGKAVSIATNNETLIPSVITG